MRPATDSTILAINDHFDQLELLRLLLVQAGYRVITAADGQEGLETAQRERPDLIVSDVSMPRMNGIEMCRRIRADAELSSIPVLLVSAVHKDTESIVEGLETGAFDYLKAPYEPTHLLAKVDRLTELSKSLKEWQHNEKRYRQLIEQAADAIFIFDTQGNILEVNPRACEMFGYTCEQLVQHNVTEFFPSEDLSASPIRFKELLEGKKVLSERRVRSRDGRLSHIEISSKLVGDNSIQAIVRDVTERKQAEELRYRLAVIVESSDDAIISSTLDGRIASWNKGAEQIYGYTSLEAISQPITILVPFERHREVQEILERIKRGEAIKHYESVWICKDKRAIHISLTVSPIKDSKGNVTGASLIARDITELKQASEQLRQQLDFTSAVTQSLGEGVYALDKKGQVTFMNPAAEKILGWTQEELLGQKMHDIIHFQRADGTRVPAEECPLLSVLHTGQSVRIEDDVFTRKDRTIIQVSYTSSPIMSDGQVAGAVLAFHDITERKQAEVEREKLIKELQSALSEVKTLQGMLPICSYCKSIRNDQNFWQKVENYITERTDVMITHGICPDCYDEVVKPQMERLKKR
jgi:PAS domain S-box-containing protein